MWRFWNMVWEMKTRRGRERRYVLGRDGWENVKGMVDRWGWGLMKARKPSQARPAKPDSSFGLTYHLLFVVFYSIYYVGPCPQFGVSTDFMF